MNNMDISKLLNELSKMDKSELEAGIKKANEILKNKNAKDSLNQNEQNSK